jgi:hypothetical protein
MIFTTKLQDSLTAATRRVLSLLIVLAALALLPGSCLAQGNTYLETRTYGAYGNLEGETSAIANSLSAATTEPLSDGEVVVHYGSATVSAKFNDPGNASYTAGSTVSGFWQDEFTINNPALTGQPGIARFTVHLNGHLTGSWAGGAIGVVGYQFIIRNATRFNDVTNRAGELYNYAPLDTTPGQFATFTQDIHFTFGSPVAVAFNVVAFVNGQAGYDSDPGSAVASVNFTFSTGGFVALNAQNQPVNFTCESRSGSARSASIAPGGSFNGFTLTNSASGRLGTSLILSGGSASAVTTNLTAAFVAPPETNVVQLASDAVDFSGTGTNIFVIQMNYNPILAQLLFGGESGLRLGWLDATLGKWFNAASGNIGGIPHFIGRAYNPATDFQLGNFGVDTTNHVAWAVVNHNSQFGVGVVPAGEKFVSVTHPASNIIRLQCLGEPGVLNRIESSATLNATNFTTLASVLADTNGAFQYDATISGSNRFYRLAYP